MIVHRGEIMIILLGQCADVNTKEEFIFIIRIKGMNDHMKYTYDYT